MDEELISLIKRLRDESAFVQSEKKHLIELYRQLLKKSEQLFNKQWLISRQHLILDDLILGRNKSTVTQCCTKFSMLTHKTQFVESYKIFGPNDYYVGEFIKSLRDKPAYLAKLIVKSEKLTTSSTSIQLISGVDNQYFSAQQLIPVYFQSLYGNCVLKQDEFLCLHLLKNLMQLQFGGQQNETTDLRRLIRKQSCSFNILFKSYTTFAYSAQLFLTAALYEPIIQVITDEWFLDIDSEKALARFNTEEIINRFGHPSSKEYKAKTQKYREKIVNQLYNATMSFIENINANLFCFPSSLSWLVSQLYQIVSKSTNKTTNQNEIARKLCCDLVMALYICPAICDPETYGVISGIQLSTVARHNLMQIANLLQTLAMSDDDKDLKAQDLYSKFRNNCVSEILNNIISTNKLRNNGVMSGLNDSLIIPQFDQQSNNAVNPINSNTNNSETASNFSSSSSAMYQNSSHTLLNRTSMLISLQDIHKIIIYMRQMSKDKNELIIESDETKWLKTIIPFDYLNQILENAANNLNSQNFKNSSSISLMNTNSTLTSNKSSSSLNQQLSVSNNNNTTTYTADSPEVIVSLVKESNLESCENHQVVIININDKDSNCPGMLNEEKVLNEQDNLSTMGLLSKFSQKNHRDQRHNNKSHRDGTSSINGSSSKKKIVRQPKLQDITDGFDSSFEPQSKQGDLIIDRDDNRSVGISEVCETNECRSISSNDEDDENDMDNERNQIDEPGDGLSDFDNFSGRDTPIISGRDTPSSVGHDTDIHNMSSSNRTNLNVNSSNQNNVLLNQNSNSINNTMINGNMNGINSINPSRGPQLPITVQKTNGEDINDKFCKFEINNVNAPREEQLSETGWSLDADPPESVNNEPLNDRVLGLDENIPSSNTNTLQSRNSSNNKLTNLTNNNSINSVSTQNGLNQNTALTNISNTNLINFNDQDSLLNVNNQNTITNNNNINSNNNDPDLNLDDRFSVVSDGAAWTTDLINNSDSDLESNSPSKYTPYSTYSSNCSGSGIQHPSINEMINSKKQDTLTTVTTNNVATTIAQALLPNSSSSSSFLNIIKNSNNHSNSNNNSFSISYSASSNNNNLNNINASTELNKSNPDSGMISWNYSQTANSSQSNEQQPNSSSSNKNRLSSIFSSNSSGVKFSLSSKDNNTKKSSFQKIFPFKNSFNKSLNNDPFASLNPFSSPSNSTSTTATTTSHSNNQLTDSNLTNNTSNTNQNQSDNIENILKKYANKNQLSSSSLNSQLPVVNTCNSNDLDTQFKTIESNNNSNNQDTLMPKNSSSNSFQPQPPSRNNSNSLFYDPKNLEQSKAFLDAKKKLRIVLSWSDCCTYNFMPLSHYKNEKDNYLTMYLKTQLYDAISLQDKEKEAQLHETMRCVSIFNESECNKLLRALKKDYVRRICYLTYLTKSKQNILYSLNLVEKLLQRAEWNQKVCTHHLASVISHTFLETKENENQMFKFIRDFRQLVAVDEKFDLFKTFIEQLKKDYDPIWIKCHEDMIQLGYTSLERLLLSKVYRYVMYPNGEIDHFRDSKVSECFKELAEVITPSHPLIGIPPIYLNECPWTAAQMELRKLNIYKTPKDKLECIHKCMLIIQNLLAIAKSPVCADDLHPVLIYVIIKANPPTFLSNVQYIEGYYGTKLEFEDYYWAQFICAYSYIKANMLGSKVVTSANNNE